MIIEVFKKGITINGTTFLPLFAFYQKDLLHTKFNKILQRMLKYYNDVWKKKASTTKSYN